MKTLAILTSGGDAPGMNAAIAAAVKVAAAAGWQTLGVRDGYEGLIAGDLIPLTPRDVDDIAYRGGTDLGSARSARFRTVEGRQEAAGHLTGIDGLLVIGGNGSLAGADALSDQLGGRLPIVGLPASIDNDIACTATAIGVDTALNTIVSACDRISDTARSHRRIFVVEVMGRDCGYLAMAAGIAASADAVIFREQGQSEAEVVAGLQCIVSAAAARGKKRVLIIKAEGVEIATSRLVEQLDAPGFTVRYTVLGHVVRGGSPSFRDRLVASRLAFAGVKCVIAGQHGMVGWESTEDGGQPTADPAIQLFPLKLMLERTAALLDGTHPVTARRVALLEQASRVLPL
ncbi:MAG: 6-phosphofructokinase 1 [Myxococcota bacterium]|jgi:6-phosphofructokinase 1